MVALKLPASAPITVYVDDLPFFDDRAGGGSGLMLAVALIELRLGRRLAPALDELDGERAGMAETADDPARVVAEAPVGRAVLRALGPDTGERVAQFSSPAR